MKVCSVSGCEGKVVCKGLCDKHRKRLERHGDVNIVLKPWGRRYLYPFVPFRYKKGYRMAKVNGQWRMVHRLVMEYYLGRPLDTDEVVHHIDGNTLNNAFDNLIITSREEHPRLNAIKEEPF